MKPFLVVAAIAISTPLTALSQVQPTDVTEQRNAAVGFALTSSKATERMLKSCAVVPEATEHFTKVQREWALRNQPYVHAASGWMSYVKSLVAKEKSPEVAEAFITNTYGVFSDQASMMAAESLPGSPPTAASCNKWAGALDSKKFDLDQNAEFAQDLREIRALIEAQAGETGR